MTHHTAEVEFGNTRVHTFEAGRLAELYPARLDSLGDSLDFGMFGDQFVVRVAPVDAASIGPNEILLQRAQFFFIADETQQYRFQTSGPSVILLVRIRRRSYYHVDGTGFQDAGERARIGLVYCGLCVAAIPQLPQILGHRTHSS